MCVVVRPMTKWLCLFALTAACGDNEPAPVVTPPAPAFAESAHGPAPQLVDVGGPVLTQPVTQPIFFTGDATMQAQIEAFDTLLTYSEYWQQTTKEYGVGTITELPTIVVADAPPTSTAALEAMLADKLDGTHTAEGWPAAADEQTIYSVFLPAGVVVHDPDGDSCASYGAFHDEAIGKHGESIIFALLPRCDYGGPLIDNLTASYSHELIEAVTDPFVETDAAYGDSDPDNYVMAFTPGAEVGDYCEYVDSAYVRLFGGFEVQRTWSNAASLAGKDPCVPSTGAYVAAVPMFTGQLKMDDYYGGTVMTRGVSIPIHTSAEVDVQLISDRPTDNFTVEAVDAAVYFGSSPELTLAFDKTTGKNGDILKLTITRAQAGQLPGSEIVIQAKSGKNVVSQWWGYVGN
jgi:hypothetical protein